MAQFKTLHFPNTASGQKKKNTALANETAAGWKIVSETITPGKFKGGEACCLFFIFMPCAFLAGSSDGTINVTLQLDGPATANTNPTPSNQNMPTSDIATFDISSFEVVLENIGPQRGRVGLIIAKETGMKILELTTKMNAVDGVKLTRGFWSTKREAIPPQPLTVRQGISQDEAIRIKDALKKVGAKALVQNTTKRSNTGE